MLHYFARKKLLALALHPGLYALAHALGEGTAEGAVAAEAALLGQLLGANVLLTGCDGLLVKTDEVIDAQTVDIGVVSVTLPREILAEVRTIGADGLRQLL